MPAGSSNITKSDVALGAPITGFITFMLLTWSKTLPPDSAYTVYVSDVSISLVASASAYIVSWVISYVRFLVSISTIKISYLVKKSAYRSILCDPHSTDKMKADAQAKLEKESLKFTQKISETSLL
ncbi:hypothetical protein [Vibrio harveyi]|uniref:hypothetical protein n=1 Tax=Vibrio harveyi TaxID=669 RepID=UPI001559DD79|nr:hypothetical protein [Vibrio harveyi]EKO3801250.1 hypothetical protein [Vibrio harveyi]EKO3851533.1 hypothetical protein [Vibrio harveyi]